MHLDDEAIQRWLHAEHEPAGRLAVSEHLAGCAACQDRLTAADQEEQWTRARLGLLDHPVPSVTSEQIRRGRRSPAWVRWAAGFLLTCSIAGVAYAVPGSPLPRWVNLARERMRSGPVAPPPEITPAPAASGITIPLEPRLTIRFAAPQSAGAVRVTLVGEGSVAVRVRNGASTFAMSPGSLLIDNQGSTADYEIDLPRASAWVAIEVRDSRILLKRDTLVRAAVPPDSAGGYTLPLTVAGDP